MAKTCNEFHAIVSTSYTNDGLVEYTLILLSWFAVTMGTGIVSILLHNLPYNARWIYWISIVFFAANVCFFVLFSFISILRYIMFPGLWTAMLRHPVQSLFLGM